MQKNTSAEPYRDVANLEVANPHYSLDRGRTMHACKLLCNEAWYNGMFVFAVSRPISAETRGEEDNATMGGFRTRWAGRARQLGLSGQKLVNKPTPTFARGWDQASK